MLKKIENLKSLDTVRERERERVVFSQIGFICDAKNNCEGKKKDSKKITKSEYKIEKRVDYEKQVNSWK